MTELGRIALGKPHLFHLATRSNPDWSGEFYVPEEIVTDPMGTWGHGREMVLYRGLTGHDKGRGFVCTLADFVTKFRLEEEPDRAPVATATTEEDPVEERVLDYRTGTPSYQKEPS